MSLSPDKHGEIPSSLATVQAELISTKDSCTNMGSNDQKCSGNDTGLSENIEDQIHQDSLLLSNKSEGSVVEENVDSLGSSPSSGVVSPCPSSVTSQDSSHKSKNESHNDTCTVDQKQPMISECNDINCGVSSKCDDSTEKSFQNIGSTSQSGDIDQQNMDESSSDAKSSLREHSNSVANSASARDSPTSSDSTTKHGQNLRRGKWTLEEEAYVARVIQDFNNGFLDAPAGTTLRSYLSDKLSCDPMRITKKFTGDACIGKRVFHPAVRIPGASAIMIDKAQSELKDLEQRWRRRMSLQRKESEKKHAASIVMNAHFQDSSSSTLAMAQSSSIPRSRVDVARTASWLDRANAILSTRRSFNEEKRAQKDNFGDKVKKEMKEVERLIKEVPSIQKTSGLLIQSNVLSSVPSDDTPSKRKVSEDQKHGVVKGSASDLNDKQDKRVRKSLSAEHLESEKMKSNFNLSAGEAEDAASFIGFISSVREEAAEAAFAKRRDRMLDQDPKLNTYEKA